MEFVSANPTGLLHMGNARGAALGDTIANLFGEGELKSPGSITSMMRAIRSKTSPVPWKPAIYSSWGKMSLFRKTATTVLT